MPPKDAKASKKTVEKEKARIIDDKTFGLKNKNKSKKVEKYIKSVQSQVANKGLDKRAELAAAQKKEEKAKAEATKKEMEMLFKPVVTQPKVPLGVDPKSVLCEFFRVGQCAKGHKCKYSHDLKVEKKAEKIDIYTDRRGGEDSMENWDDAKLNQVVAEKRTEVNINLKTTIICKYFIDAIEQQKYGWFWECPNGGEKCMYVHALPPGYVLKKKKSDDDEEEEEPTPLEEIIEEQRRQLTKLTPVTLETFLKWKEEKKRKKEETRKAAEEKRLADAGKTQMSGREMFVFNPDVFVDDDEAADDDDYRADDDYQAPDESFKNKEEEEGTTVDNLNVQVNESLFLNGDIDDIPSDDEDEAGDEEDD